METSSFFYVMIFYSLQLIFIVLKELQAESFGPTFGCCIHNWQILSTIWKTDFFILKQNKTPPFIQCLRRLLRCQMAEFWFTLVFFVCS